MIITKWNDHVYMSPDGFIAIVEARVNLARKSVAPFSSSNEEKGKGSLARIM